ncbi:MAG: hypothetical protein VX061_18015 [Pseudomonadota bacterium]|nr:hypothetical protein [Pseudomonadota bacterium]
MKNLFFVARAVLSLIHFGCGHETHDKNNENHHADPHQNIK